MRFVLKGEVDLSCYSNNTNSENVHVITELVYQ